MTLRVLQFVSDTDLTEKVDDKEEGEEEGDTGNEYY